LLEPPFASDDSALRTLPSLLGAWRWTLDMMLREEQPGRTSAGWGKAKLVALPAIRQSIAGAKTCEVEDDHSH
jgi:hypothetical protein